MYWVGLCLQQQPGISACQWSSIRTPFDVNEVSFAPAGRVQGASHAMHASHSGRSAGSPAFMPATPQQPLPPGAGDLLDEDEDYVIIEGVSPFASAHGVM